MASPGWDSSEATDGATEARSSRFDRSAFKPFRPKQSRVVSCTHRTRPPERVCEVAVVVSLTAQLPAVRLCQRTELNSRRIVQPR